MLLLAELGLVLVGLAASPFVSQAPQRQARTIWTGRSDGFTIRWTSDNITASSSHDATKIVFSARKLAQEEFEAFKKDQLEEGRDAECSYTLTFKLLSVVGSIISYEETEDSYCKSSNGKWAWPHPSNRVDYHSVDLSEPAKRLDMTTLFSEGAILKALLADPLVVKALGSRAQGSPKTVAEFMEFFEDGTLSLVPLTRGSRTPKGCTFTFPDNALNQFAFHHLEGGELAVRMSLQPDSGVCRTAHTELGIMLPIPEKLKTALSLAATGKEGFLMKDLREIAPKQVVTFSFGGRLER